MLVHVFNSDASRIGYDAKIQHPYKMTLSRHWLAVLGICGLCWVVCLAYSRGVIMLDYWTLEESVNTQH